MDFYSKILTYPADVRKKIDALLDENVNLKTIVKFLQENYGDKLKKFPSLSTLGRYAKWYRTGEFKSDYGGFCVKNPNITENKDVLDLQVDFKSSNKQALLENLIQTCYNRLSRISDIQNLKRDPRWETMITRYIESLRQLIETLSKLRGELKDEQQTIIIAQVQAETVNIIKMFKDIVLEVCPDKVDIFQQKLKEKFSTFQL